MGKSSATSKDAQALFHSLRSAYAATPTNLKVPTCTHTHTINTSFVQILIFLHIISINFYFLQIIDLYVIFAVATALIQVIFPLSFFIKVSICRSGACDFDLVCVFLFEVLIFENACKM